MHTHLTYNLAILASFLAVICQIVPAVLPAGLGIQPFVNSSQPSNDCPSLLEIYPCYCLTADGNPDLVCNGVHDEEQLHKIFHRIFLSNHFRRLTIVDNLNIRNLSEGIFGRKTFQEIVINLVPLETVEPGAFNSSIDTLEHIAITQSNLISFPFEELPQYGHLSKLLLSANLLTSFPSLTSETLSVVDLSWNSISTIPDDAFVNVPNLTSFMCFDCGIDEIISGTFFGFPNFTYLNLDKNGLTILPDDVIELNGDGGSLILSENKLSNISVNAISVTAEHLSIVDVSSNNLQILDSEIWLPLMEKVTDKFYAHDNPLLCECDVAWLILTPDFMEKLDGKVSCQDGTLLIDLDPEYYREMCY